MGTTWTPLSMGRPTRPADEAAFNEKLRELEARKSEAIATDDLERALHLKNAISVLK